MGTMLQDTIYNTSVEFPTYTNSEIATILGCSNTLVSIHRKPREARLCLTCLKLFYSNTSKLYCKLSCRPSKMEKPAINERSLRKQQYLEEVYSVS